MQKSLLDLDADPRRYLLGSRSDRRRNARGASNAPTEMPDEIEQEVGME